MKALIVAAVVVAGFSSAASRDAAGQESRIVYFVGGVGRPGPVRLPDGRLTILQAVILAGGFAASADEENAFVLRDGVAIPINFRAIMKSGDMKNNIVLEPGDTVVIPIADAPPCPGGVKPRPKFTRDLSGSRKIPDCPQEPRPRWDLPRRDLGERPSERDQG